MTFIHPLSLLADHSSILPTDLALESRDCASLYSALREHSFVEGDKFHPDNFFKGGELLRQADILKYEEELKNIVICSVLHDPDSMHTMVSSLTNKALNDPEVDHPPSRQDFINGLIVLVRDLHKLDELVGFHMSFLAFLQVFTSILSSPLFCSPLTEQTARSWQSSSPLG